MNIMALRYHVRFTQSDKRIKRIECNTVKNRGLHPGLQTELPYFLVKVGAVNFQNNSSDIYLALIN